MSQFDRVLRRIDRAKQHLVDFEREINIFLESNPLEQVTRHYKEKNFILKKLVMINPLSHKIEDLAFDIASNLRPPLDQSAYCAALAAGKQNPKHAYFPIADSAKELGNVIKGRCKDIPPKIINLFQSFKHYREGNYVVWALNKVANANKHCIVVPMAVDTGGYHINNLVIGNLTSGFRGLSNWDIKKREMIIAEYGHGSKIYYDVEISYYVSFGMIDGVYGEAAVPLFAEMINEVERIILETKGACEQL